MNRFRLGVVVIVMALAFGCGWAAWRYHERTLEQTFAEGHFFRALNDITDANVALTLLDKQKPEAAREFLEMKLVRGLNEADQLLKSHARFFSEHGPTPNLHVVMRRAKAYAESHPRLGKAAPSQAQRLMEATQTRPEKL